MIDFTRYPNPKLPLPLLKSHRLNRNAMLLETKQDSGYTRKRRRFKNPPADMPITLLLSGDQFEIFEGWYHHIIHSGQDWFVMPIKVGKVLVDHECQFKGDYSTQTISQSLWKITAKLKIKNLRVISEDETLGRIHDLSQPTQVVRDALDESITEYVSE